MIEVKFGDKYDEALCPLKRLQENDDPPVLIDCRMPLHLVRMFTIPIGRESQTEDFGAADAVTSGWRVECEDGHVLLTNADFERPEKFDPAFLGIGEREPQQENK